MQAEIATNLDTLGVERRPGTLERWLFVLLTLLSFGLTAFQGVQDSDTGSPVAQVLWGAVYALAALGLIRERRFFSRLARRSMPLLLILALAVLSTAWSDDPFLTLKRAAGLVGTTAIAYYLVSRYSLDAFVDTLILAISVTAIASAILIAVAPEQGVMQAEYAGAWRGIFFQKNGLGVMMALGIATMQTRLAHTHGRHRFALIAAMLLCFVLLLGSRSGTGLVTLLVLVVGVPLVLRLWTTKFRVPAILFTGTLLVLGFCANAAGIGPDQVLGLIGRDTTLTGRTDVWTIATEHISERPLLGWGYRVFWEPDGPVHRYLLKDLGWEPDSAHNGYLEVALNFGLAGAVIFTTFLFQGLRRASRYLSAHGSGVGAWPLIAVLYAVVSNFAETSFAMYNTIGWVVLVVAYLYATETAADDAYLVSPASPLLPEPAFASY